MKLFDVVREGVQITPLTKNLQSLRQWQSSRIGMVFPPARTTRTAVWIRKTSSHDAIVLRRNIAIETLRHPSENTGQVDRFLFALEFVKWCSNIMVGYDVHLSLICSDSRPADWVRHFGAFYLEARRGNEKQR